MINSFRMLGKSILQSEGYYNEPEGIKKRKFFLNHQSLPMVKKKSAEETEHAIALNFDTQKQEFYFAIDKEITPANKDYFFAFKATSNVTKKFFATNNIACFYKNFFKGSLSYLAKERKGSKTKKWLGKISKEYDLFLAKIQDIFYVANGKDYFLNQELLRPDQKQIFDKLESEYPEEDIGNIYDRLLNHKFFNCSSKANKEFPKIFLLKINERHIIEHEDYKESYINLVYYDLLERFFVKHGRKDKICHICQTQNMIIGEKIPLLMKFYGTTNNLYFENLNNKNAHKSFAICRDCLAETLTGMKYVENELGDYFLGISAYLIPSFENEQPQFGEKYKRIFNLLKSNKGYKEDIDEIEKLIKKSGKKNFIFDLLFFYQNKQEFDILKLISNIEYKNLVQKLGYFDCFGKKYDLALIIINGINQQLTLNDVRYNLFPSKSSHTAKDIGKLYRKDTLNFFEAFLNGYAINYADIIRRFIDIYNRRFHRDTHDILAPFKMGLIFLILNKIKPLKGLTMSAGNAITEIQNTDYQDFFKTHEEIYKENYYRQGLFLLGTVIHKIVSAQRKKASGKIGATHNDSDKTRKKSGSTFLKKLNYSGIPTRRINGLLAEVKQYTEIYDDYIYEESGIWGNIMDRLQGLEDSDMKGEEVVFYLLTGISYATYLSMTHSKKEKGEK